MDAPANRVFSSPITYNLLSKLCILMKILSHASAKRKTKRLWKFCAFIVFKKRSDITSVKGLICFLSSCVHCLFPHSTSTQVLGTCMQRIKSVYWYTKCNGTVTDLCMTACIVGLCIKMLHVRSVYFQEKQRWTVKVCWLDGRYLICISFGNSVNGPGLCK